MTCMCGDTMCPSCGPAQGYNPDFESVKEMFDGLFDGLLNDDEVNSIVGLIGESSDEGIIDSVVVASKRYFRRTTLLRKINES